MFGTKKRAGAARIALRAIVNAGGSVDEALAAIEVLRTQDRKVFETCETLIRAGNSERAIKLLDQVGGAPDKDRSEAAARAPVPLRSRAILLSWVSWGVWLAIAASLWLAYPGVGPSLALLAVGWVVTIGALVAGQRLIRSAYDDYLMLEHLGSLLFLAVPFMLPIGLIWTVAQAVRIGSGKVTGQGHDPNPGGGYSRFDVANVGDAGRPSASTLYSVALGYPAALAALVIHSGVVEHMSFGASSPHDNPNVLVSGGL